VLDVAVPEIRDARVSWRVRSRFADRHSDLHRSPDPAFHGAAWKDRKNVAQAHRAADAKIGQAALDAFAQSPWGEKYPAIAQSWRRNWDLVIPFFAFPEGVRKIIYTTNAIEALNSKLRRAIRTRGHFPSDDAAAKLLYLVLNHAAADWKRPPREWFEAKTQFAVMFKERFVLA
jgi:putative transposase